MMARCKTNADGWRALFVELDLSSRLTETGRADVTATQIKTISGREPRLMSKFDTRDARPAALKESNTTILPTANGYYALVAGDGYANVPGIEAITSFHWPKADTLQTLPTGFQSESQVIDAVHASGLLSRFVNDSDTVLTVRGRLRSPAFSFSFRGPGRVHSLDVEGVQVEVDAGYEGDAAVYLIEAKLGERDDFHVRQLYYPYRMWRKRGVTKPLVPIFLTYANGVISLAEYGFRDENEYGSIELIRSENFSFETHPVHLSLGEVVARTKSLPSEPEELPFPQADDIRKVRDTIDIIASGCDTRDTLAEYWTIDKRQGDYYANAAAFIGYIVRDGHTWKITEEGAFYLALPNSQRNIHLAQAILVHPVFYMTANAYLEKGLLPARDEIAEIIQKYTMLSGSTPARRAGTVASWVGFIARLFG